MAPSVVYVVLHEAEGVTTILSAYASAKDANAAVAVHAASSSGKNEKTTNSAGLARWADADSRCWVEKVDVVPDSSSGSGAAGAVEGGSGGDAGKGGAELPRSKSKLYVPEEDDDKIVENDDDGDIYN